MPAVCAAACVLAAHAVAAEQAGAITRAQAVDLGLTPRQVKHLVTSGRWQWVLPRVYLVFTGHVSYMTRAWTGLLYAGPGAALGMQTAEYLWRLSDTPPDQVHVIVPVDRRVAKQPGLRIHIRTAVPLRMHPARLPPMTRVEETVLDLVEQANRAEEVVDLLTRACQRRLTTAPKLWAAAEKRKKLRWRGLVAEVVDDVRDGAVTVIERRWRRDVELAHGLPTGSRNRREVAGGRSRYRDVRYLELQMVVELDGRAAHPDELRHRDMRRDNAIAEVGDVTLRYGWADIASSPCEVAAQFVRVARLRGWTGTPRGCCPACPLNPTAS